MDSCDHFLNPGKFLASTRNSIPTSCFLPYSGALIFPKHTPQVTESHSEKKLWDTCLPGSSFNQNLISASLGSSLELSWCQMLKARKHKWNIYSTNICDTDISWKVDLRYPKVNTFSWDSWLDVFSFFHTLSGHQDPKSPASQRHLPLSFSNTDRLQQWGPHFTAVNCLKSEEII